MFVEAYETSPYTNNPDFDEEIIDNIIGISDGEYSSSEDTTFMTTLKILLGDRVEDFVTYIFHLISCGGLSLLNFHQKFGVRDSLYVCLVDKKDIDTLPDKIDTHECLKDVEIFLKQKCDICCRIYTSDSLKNAVVVIEDSIRAYHAVQSMIPRYLPWYFEEKPCSVDEKELLKSILNKTSQKYEEMVMQFYNKTDFRNTKIERLLCNISERIYKQELNKVNSNITHIRQMMDETMMKYGDLVTQLDKFIVEEAGLREVINRDKGQDSEFVEYFKCNKSLSLQEANDGFFVFVVSSFLENFDSDMMEQFLNNPNSNISQEIARFSEDYIPLIKAIFVDRLLKVRCVAAYKIRYIGSATALYDYRFGVSYNGFSPNQHIQKHGCLGAYATYINKAIANKDYIEAVEECIASCKSINVGETVSIIPQIDDILSGRECIVLPDGKAVSAKQALKYLNEEGVRHNEE